MYAAVGAHRTVVYGPCIARDIESSKDRGCLLCDLVRIAFFPFAPRVAAVCDPSCVYTCPRTPKRVVQSSDHVLGGPDEMLIGGSHSVA